MSSRHKFLLVLGFVIAGVVSYGLTNLDGNGSARLPPSTFSTQPNGYKAAFLLLEELKLPTARLRSRYTRLDSVNRVLIVLDPHLVPFSRKEIESLIQWVRSGNTLILFHGGPKIRSPLKPVVGRSGESEAMKRADSKGRSAVNRGSLAEKLDLVLSRARRGGRSTVEVSLPKLYGVNRLSVSNHTRWKGVEGKWTTLVEDKEGPIIVSRKMGRGEVTAISDASMASNGALPLEHNVRLIPALVLQKGKPDKVLFDEYHRGYTAAESFWHYAAASVFGWILVQVLVAGVLWIYSRRASHAGRYRSLKRPAGRSSLEYVRGMANVFESSRAGTAALDAIVNRFLGQLSRKTGIPLKNMEHEADARIESLVGLQAGSSDLIRECREAIRAGTETPRILTLARRLGRVQALVNRRPRQGIPVAVPPTDKPTSAKAQ
ncbi:MAG: DUF4350 domain-containing protein [Desulfomonilaceae bacterium]|nr:DUF4350 domain-containing protein [Desulfomonilaceae bacterium]